MFGWRGKVGAISPSLAEGKNYEFYRVVPEGVLLVEWCLPPVTRIVAEEIDRALAGLEEGVDVLTGVEVGVILVGGTAPFYAKGPAYTREVRDRLRKRTATPLIMSVDNVVAGLQAVGARRIAVASPYPDPINEKMRAYLAASGLEIIGLHGLGYESNHQISLLPREASFHAACEVFRRYPEADAIYLPCPRWPTVENIQPLEKDLGVPVITATQVDIWGALRALGIHASITGYGGLLASLARRDSTPSPPLPPAGKGRGKSR